MSVWSFGVWLLLTWTVTLEQLVFGAILSIAVGVALRTTGSVVPPWRVIGPRRLAAIAVLAGSAVVRIVRANVGLARRIWSPRRPLASGMLIVPTSVTSDGAVAATGLITSLIVDNQIVDVDRHRHLLQYHAVSVPRGGKEAQSEAINAPVERMIAQVEGGAS